MSLNIRPSTSEELKQIFAEILFNKTSKINKISNNSVLNGVAYGVGKIGQKCEKDIILALSKLYPDSAYDTQLDQVAQDNGIAPRFGASQSSTYVRVVGNQGTTYTAGIHTFQSVDGIQFDLEESKTIGVFGFDYLKVRSVSIGISTNVKPGTISTVNPTPAGHRFVTNEFQALYGRDVENDIQFRQRIKNGPSILSQGTISTLEQAFILINPNVLRCTYQGINDQGQVKIAIVTQNGINLNISELNDLLVKGERFFNFSELRPFGRQSFGVVLSNIDWQPLDISFRCDLFPSFNVDDIRIDIQTRINKYLDFRLFKSGVDKIDWVKLLEIVRNTKGVKYVPDTYFYPSVDQATDPNKMPRMRGFLMLNLQGVVINTIAGSLNPVFYPNAAGFELQQTALSSLS